MVDLNRGAKFLVYAALFTIGFFWMFLFINYVMPVAYPMLMEGRLWTVWLVCGPFMVPFGLLLCYVAIRITGSLWQFDRTQWKIVAVGTPLGFIYLAALGYVFSSFIPADYEAFRSITLPGLVLAATVIVLGQTKYAKKYRVQKKEACAQAERTSA